MWVQVRTFDGKLSHHVDNLSKLTKIEDFREKLVDVFGAPVDSQLLFYRGKQLVDGHTLYDYDVGLNDIIQLMIRKKPAQAPSAPASDSQNGKADSGFASDSSDVEHGSTEESEEKGEEKTEEKGEEKTEEKGEEKTEAMEEEASTSASSHDTGLRGIYKSGDIIDAMDLSVGAWFEAEIIKVTKPEEESQEDTNNNETKSDPEPQTNSDKSTASEEDKSNSEILVNRNVEKEPVSKEEENNQLNCNSSSNSNTPSSMEGTDGLVYHVRFEDYSEDGTVELTSKFIRPRARRCLYFRELKVGDVVMGNYNCDDPEARGFWYDIELTSVKKARTYYKVIGNIRLGPGVEPLKECRIKFTDEIFKIEKGGEISCDPQSTEGTPLKRQTQPECDRCCDNPNKKCKFCSCHACGGKEAPNKQIMCDECDMAYHIYCLDPPLLEIPDVEEWYCPVCKNDTTEVVQAGEKLKHSKKKARMASAKSTSNRDWGKGMACQGRSKVCTIVPPNHFGEVPGIHVGQMWKFRVQVSEVGVHRPHVAGIHGREIEGAYSIVLSGGYEDDEDNGDEFTYTGSGGRDLSGNKRTAEQSCDQKLTKMNKALAKNCNTPLDKDKGGEAKDWRGGKPVRVVRNCKGRKHSKYAPEEGNRYDGIYKIVKYWPEKGKSGFRVWRYMLRRDDPQPAPWTKAGKKKIKDLGLEIEFPEGYLESMAAKEKEKNKTDSDEESGTTKKKGKRKKDDSSTPSKSSPKAKKQKREIPSDLKEKVQKDEKNVKIWDGVAEEVKGGEKLLTAVEEAFSCICCQEVAYLPITTPCQHNICKPCLKRSFKADVFSCPNCRHDLGKEFKMNVNTELADILRELFPGYEASRD